MTEPSKWALNAAVAALGEPIRPYQAEAVALALDAARRQALEEAAKIAHDYCWMPAVGSRMQNYAAQIEDCIRALIDKEPMP